MSNRPPTFQPGPASHTGKPRYNAKKRRKRQLSHSSGPQSAARRAPRPAEIRARRKRVLVGLYAILAVEVIAALLTSPALAIKRVQASGLEILPATESTLTLRALDVMPQTNWFRVPMGRLHDTTATLPWVQEVTVERHFPNRLTAHIVPRQPFMIVRAGNTVCEVDADHVPIRKARPEMLRHLPHVAIAPQTALVPGLPISSSGLTAVVQILQDLQQDSAVRLAKIEVDQSDNICLNMQDGIAIQMGRSEDVATKVALVKRIYSRDPHIGVQVASINLSCPSAPACTPRVTQVTPLLPGLLLPMGTVTP